MGEYIKILRINHWFKNFFILFGFFGAHYYLGVSLQELDFAKIIGGFFLASLISSVNYIINQITDAEFDKLHPTKKFRPLASGKISFRKSYFLAYFIFFIAVVVSFSFYSPYFSWTLIMFLAAGIFYNITPIRLKDRPYLDVVSESVNNPIRFLLGWFIVTGKSLPPLSLLLFTWSAGAILMTAKRYDEKKYFGKEIVPYRKTFESYTISSLKKMLYFYSILTIIFYAIFSLTWKMSLLWLLPPFLIFLNWVLGEITSGRAKTRKAEGFVLRYEFLFFLTLAVILFFLTNE